jgi:biotin carboxylase
MLLENAAVRTLLILAASIYQLPVIERAKALGLRVVAVDNRPENPGHALADASYNADTRDVASIMAIARAEQIDGILAAATDVALATAAAVGQALGLVAPSTKVVEALVPKDAFRRCQEALGLPSPRYWTDPERVDDEGPFVVKPVLGSGSRGISLCRSRAELPTAFALARDISRAPSAIVETVLVGTQHTAEGILTDGSIGVWIVTDRLTVPPPHTATAGHRVPTCLSTETCEKVQRQIERVFAALEYRNGPFDADFVATTEGPVLIELTPRAGGNALMRVLPTATGFDYTGYLVRHAIGAAEPPACPFGILPVGIDILGADAAARLYYRREKLDEIRKEQWCKHLVLDVLPGALVPAFVDGRTRYGEVLVVGPDRDVVESRLAQVRERLSIETIKL